ncbi:DUF3159 domain-containing protein [Nocardia callitridis]|uniref:DUF3159 domain-containing protein n=1 Tax=Nocardia callitridis TaxID=648753 RepID=A0ABP9KYM8_9NOCA
MAKHRPHGESLDAVGDEHHMPRTDIAVTPYLAAEKPAASALNHRENDMTTLEVAHTADTDVNDADSAEPANLQQAMLDGMGGTKGMVYSALPVIIFVTANAFLPLPITIGISIAAAAALTLWRRLRGEALMSASGGLFGVVAASAVSLWTGSASGFFLIGIWASAAGALVTLGSLLARRPLTGVIWNAVHGGKHEWRADRPTLRAHDVATGAALAVFAARFAVMQWLYVSDATGWLGVAKIATGTPLTVLAALVIVWAFRRSTKRLIKADN